VLKKHCTIEKHDKACRLNVENLLRSKFNVTNSVLQIESSCSSVN